MEEWDCKADYGTMCLAGLSLLFDISFSCPYIYRHTIFLYHRPLSIPSSLVLLWIVSLTVFWWWSVNINLVQKSRQQKKSLKNSGIHKLSLWVICAQRMFFMRKSCFYRWHLLSHLVSFSVAFLGLFALKHWLCVVSDGLEWVPVFENHTCYSDELQ